MLLKRHVKEAKKSIKVAEELARDAKGKTASMIAYESGYITGMKKMLRFLLQYQNRKD